MGGRLDQHHVRYYSPFRGQMFPNIAKCILAALPPQSPDVEVPNDFVDTSSWKSSACYPRRTFYPLSDGLTTKHHRITMTDLRLCSTCWFHSQAGLCHYTQKLITDQLEPTFVHLRYSFAGDRPSQTTRHTMSQALLQGL